MPLTRPALALPLVVLAACAPRPPVLAALPPALSTDLPADMALPASDGLQPGQRQARFAQYPDRLLTAARAACSAPGQSPQEPAPGLLRCETLPTPEIAAALILTYNGTVESLPLYVVSFTATPDGPGYLVTADSYVVVPQPDGTLREIRLSDPAVEAGMTDLLLAAGGTPA